MNSAMLPVRLIFISSELRTPWLYFAAQMLAEKRITSTRICELISGFYGKPDKQYTIARCAHCKQFRISLDALIQMFESYGVPRCRIMYENKHLWQPFWFRRYIRYSMIWVTQSAKQPGLSCCPAAANSQMCH